MWSKEINRKIQTTAASLLKEGKVDLVIGYQAGSSPLRTSPCFVRKPEHATLLIWTPFCENNLTVFLSGRSERIGLVAKGCDARSAVVALQERRIDRERLTVIGLPCSGIVDRKKLDSMVDADRVESFSLNGEALILKGKEDTRIPLDQVLHASCISCSRRNAPLSDIFIDTKSPEPDIKDEFADVKAFEAKSPKERWQHFMQMAQKCIRCYACRNACPLCYCQECVVDQTQPQWFGKTTAAEDVLVYHIMRAYHAAGRCIDCGACSRACPMGIDLRLLNKKLQKEVRELYGYIPGLDQDAPPALGVYKADDPQECITEK
jgi:formate dehydrogenase subunit beta